MAMTSRKAKLNIFSFEFAKYYQRFCFLTKLVSNNIWHFFQLKEIHSVLARANIESNYICLWVDIKFQENWKPIKAKMKFHTLSAFSPVPTLTYCSILHSLFFISKQGKQNRHANEDPFSFLFPGILDTITLHKFVLKIINWSENCLLKIIITSYG